MGSVMLFQPYRPTSSLLGAWLWQGPQLASMMTSKQTFSSRVEDVWD